MSEDKNKKDDFEEEIDFDELDEVEIFSDSSDDSDSEELSSELDDFDEAEEFDLSDEDQADKDESLEDDLGESNTSNEEESPLLDDFEFEESEDKDPVLNEDEDLDLDEEIGLDSELEKRSDDSSEELDLEEVSDQEEETEESNQEDPALEDDFEFGDDPVLENDDQNDEDELENLISGDSEDDLSSDTDRESGDLEEEEDLEVVDLDPVDFNELEDSIESDKDNKSKSESALSLTDEEKQDMKEIDTHEKKSSTGKNLVLSATIIGCLSAGAYFFAGDEIKNVLGLGDSYSEEAAPAVSGAAAQRAAEKRKAAKEALRKKTAAKQANKSSAVEGANNQQAPTNPKPNNESFVDNGKGLALDLDEGGMASSRSVMPDDSEFNLDVSSPEVEVSTDIEEFSSVAPIDDVSFDMGGEDSKEFVSKEKYDELVSRFEELEAKYQDSNKALMGLTREFQLSERELNAKIIASDRDLKTDLQKVLKVAAIAFTKSKTNSAGIEQVSLDVDRKIDTVEGKISQAASEAISAEEAEELKKIIADQQKTIRKLSTESEERLSVMEKRITELTKTSANKKHDSEVGVEELLNGSETPINIKIERESEEGTTSASSTSAVPYKLMGFLPNKVYLFRDGTSYEIEVGSYLPEYGEITRLNYSTKEVFYGDGKRVNIVY